MEIIRHFITAAHKAMGDITMNTSISYIQSMTATGIDKTIGPLLLCHLQRFPLGCIGPFERVIPRYVLFLRYRQQLKSIKPTPRSSQARDNLKDCFYTTDRTALGSRLD